MITIHAVPARILKRKLTGVMEKATDHADVYLSGLKTNGDRHFFNLHVEFHPEHAVRSKDFLQDLEFHLKAAQAQHSSPTAVGGLIVTAASTSDFNHLVLISHSNPRILEALRSALLPHVNRRQEQGDLTLGGVEDALNKLLKRKPGN